MEELIKQLKYIKSSEKEIKVDLYFKDNCFLEVTLDEISDELIKFHRIEMELGENEKNLETNLFSKLIQYYWDVRELNGIGYCISSIPSDFDMLEFLE